MENYLLKQKELKNLAEEKAEKIVTDLISKCWGRTTRQLRNMTLDFIRKNCLPDEVASKVKKKIDDYILELKIPTQNE